MKLICQFSTIAIEELFNIIPKFIRKIKLVKSPKVKNNFFKMKNNQGGGVVKLAQPNINIYFNIKINQEVHMSVADQWNKIEIQKTENICNNLIYCKGKIFIL